MLSWDALFDNFLIKKMAFTQKSWSLSASCWLFGFCCWCVTFRYFVWSILFILLQIKFQQCSRYNTSSILESQNDTITCDLGWTYDTSQYKSSIVSEVRTIFMSLYLYLWQSFFYTKWVNIMIFTHFWNGWMYLQNAKSEKIFGDPWTHFSNCR